MPELVNRELRAVRDVDGGQESPALIRDILVRFRSFPLCYARIALMSRHIRLSS